MVLSIQDGDQCGVWVGVMPGQQKRRGIQRLVLVAGDHSRSSGQFDTGFRDLVGHDGLIACTASMLGNMQCSTHLVSISGFSHQDDGICI